MAFVPSTDNVRIPIHELGGPDDADAPILVLAHATGFHGRVFGPMANAGLTDRFRCVAPDLRGHGDSEVPDGFTYEWRGVGDDIGAVLGALDRRPVYGFGHSMGGAALVLAELAAPGTFEALYLFEPIIPPAGLMDRVDRPNPLADGAERRREVFESFDAAYENYAGKAPLNVFTPEALRAYVDFGFAQQDDGTVRLKCRGAVEAQTYRMAGGHHAFDRLGEVKCPVTVAIGEPVESGPPAFAPAIVARLTHGRMERFPHVGHFGPMQAPADLAAAVLAALTPNSGS